MIKFTNNASATLAASINSTVTTIALTAGQGALFPSTGGGDYFYATLVDSSNNLEIVKVTTRAIDTLTVIRAQDYTTAKSFIAGDRIELRPVAAALEAMQAETTAVADDLADHIADPTAAHAASAVSYTPAGDLAATNVQGAIDELDTEKLSKVGGTMTGALSVTVSGTSTAVTGQSGGALNYGGSFKNNNGGILISFDAGGSTTANRIFTGANAGVEKVYCDVSGNFVASGNVTAYSDERLKTEIETISAALELVEQLRGVRYTKDGERGIGVVAQEMLEVLPEVVHTNDHYLSVAYGNIVGVLIEAVKELSNKVRTLEAR